MTAEEIFVHRYGRLVEILAQRRGADLLDAAAIMRQLLLDETTLLAAVNRRFRLRLRFPVAESTMEALEALSAIGPPPVLIWSDGHERKRNVRYVPLRGFLRHTFLFAAGYHFTARDIIKMSANRLGGVHLGSEKGDDDAELRLRRLGEWLNVHGTAAPIAALYPIGRSVEAGLLEIFERANEWVKANRSIDARFPWLKEVEGRRSGAAGDS